MASPGQDPSDRQPFSVPLFPLRTVLFPGGVLPLKIFEQRYVEMAKACLRDARPFGVCLIMRGEEVAALETPPPEFATIGTLASIASWEMPQLGIFHVATQGGLRFQVQKYSVAPSGLVVGTVSTLAAEATLPLPEKHAPLACTHHVGLWNYTQNVVRRAYTPGGAAIDGVAELHFRSRESFDTEFYDSDDGRAAIRQDVTRFMAKPGGSAALMRELPLR